MPSCTTWDKCVALDRERMCTRKSMTSSSDAASKELKSVQSVIHSVPTVKMVLRFEASSCSIVSTAK